MEIIKIEKKYTTIITDIAYHTYLEEYESINNIPVCSKEYMRSCIENAITSMYGYMYIEKEEILGFLMCEEDQSNNDVTKYRTPVWGYGAIGKHRDKNLCIRGIQRSRSSTGFTKLCV